MRLRMAMLLLAAYLMAAAAPVAADEIIRFGIAEEPNPPFTVKDTTGAWTGWEVDLRDAICAKLNATCEWVDTPWDELVGDLKAKRFDVIWSSLPITEDGKKSIMFSDRYYALPTALAGSKTLAADASPEALRGKVIGVLAATPALSYANRHFKGYVREIKVYQSVDDTNADLVGGRIDAELGDELTLTSFLAADPGGQCCKLLGTVANDRKTLGEGFAAGLRKADTDLRDRINGAIKAIRASGEYDAITRRYFGFDVYGG